MTSLHDHLYRATGSTSTALQPSQDECRPLLQAHTRYGSLKDVNESSGGDDQSVNEITGEAFDKVPKSKRTLGLASATSLIFNRVIATGVFAAPSLILRSSGSVGMTFVMWILGALVAATGTAVYVELGTGLPRSGGEKTYMEHIYQRPKFLITCMCAAFGIFLGSLSAAGRVFSEYTLQALDIVPTPFNLRITAVSCLTFAMVVHGVFLNWGLRVQNALGLFKFLVIILISFSGLFVLAGVPGFEVRPEYEKPNNYTWGTFWEGTNLDLNAFVTGMYNAIWSFVGYSNANYAMSEIRDPVRTIRIAAPLSMLFVTFAYLSMNIAYYAVVAKDDMLNSSSVAAALLFRNLYGPEAARVISAIIALSTLGSVLAIIFTMARFIQEIGREGVLPFSSFFASNKPFGAPFATLFTQWFIATITIMITPPGDAYLFVVNLSSYPLTIYNTLVSGGLLLLYTPAYKSFGWNPPFRAYKSATIFFFVSNVFLLLVPYVPPAPGHGVYKNLPYWSHLAVALGIGGVGIAYWFVCFYWIPKRRGYRLEQVEVMQEDGVSRNILKKVPL
ncbi:APC amino acid permease [Coniophora puteana RWD-64-598 SS2]|uniref:APC amino acid permease n=1 Tax=Coniophora puteana (strain RWD-64-598) TaxID=741705 RepID=A0A5M3MEH4_CONPW|nr:APC amino acid permease [Coniophora puteana RWD-64-598 SS2]EIW77194.1 APC amino acid permease [Coniophora puteana RWD-64-598 SS2]